MRYSPAAKEAEAVVAHLQKSDPSIISVAPNRLLVSADGTTLTTTGACAATHVSEAAWVDGGSGFSSYGEYW